MTVNEDANWNHKTSCTNDYYLDYYMSKIFIICNVPIAVALTMKLMSRGNGVLCTSRCLRRANLTINGGVLRMSRGFGLLHINDIDGRYWKLF